MKISLLHATYRDPQSALAVREAWISRSRGSAEIEHIFAMDDDDEASIAATERMRRVISPGSPHVTAVRNWNAAAVASTGELLFVIADDLRPREGWDEHLIGIVGQLDPRSAEFAVKVGDSRSPDDVLLRHPVVSRAFYDTLGLFSSTFRGVYADNDLTIRAFRRAAILDGRRLVLEHDHPFEITIEATESQDRMNQATEYAVGVAALRSRWSRSCRRARIRLVRPSPGLTEPRLMLVARWLRLTSDLEQPVILFQNARERFGSSPVSNASLRRH